MPGPSAARRSRAVTAATELTQLALETVAVGEGCSELIEGVDDRASPLGDRSASPERQQEPRAGAHLRVAHSSCCRSKSRSSTMSLVWLVIHSTALCPSSEQMMSTASPATGRG